MMQNAVLTDEVHRELINRKKSGLLPDNFQLTSGCDDDPELYARGYVINITSVLDNSMIGYRCYITSEDLPGDNGKIRLSIFRNGGNILKQFEQDACNPKAFSILLDEFVEFVKAYLTNGSVL